MFINPQNPIYLLIHMFIIREQKYTFN